MVNRMQLAAWLKAVGVTEDCFSDLKPAICDVPRGLVLNLLLFVIVYTNDLDDNL